MAWNSTSPKLTLHTRPITSTNYLINHNVTNSLSAVLTPSLNSHTPPPKHLRILQQYSPGELGKWAMSQAQLLAKLGSTTTTLCAPEHPFLPTSCSTIPTPTGLYWGPKFPRHTAVARPSLREGATCVGIQSPCPIPH